MNDVRRHHRSGSARSPPELSRQTPGLSAKLRGAITVALLLLLVLRAHAAANADIAAVVSREGAVLVTVTATTRRAVFPDEGDDDVPPVGGASAHGGGEPSLLPLHERPNRSVASGFVISADGYILTSAHAVSGSDELSVHLADGRELEGKLVGADARTDVALLKVTATGLPAATIGDSRKLVVGEWVAALGAPFGLEASVTAGIVSARRYFSAGGGVAFIQTDVVTNPGSSGGPLFNLRGEVVGMNSMIYSSSGGYMGVSFALPIETAMDVARQLRASGRIVRGQLGIPVQEVSLGIAQAFGRMRGGGAIVTRVDAGSAAGRSGLEMGDILLGIGGPTELSYAELQRLIAATPPGTVLELEVWRANRVRRVRFEVQAAIDTAASGEPADPVAAPGDVLGLVLEDLPAARARASAEGGVVVRESRGQALRGGITEDDIILRLNESATPRLADYRAALSRLPEGAPVALLIVRDGARAYFPLGPVFRAP